ncbi:MAG: methylated-DNA--[protein]-cysteine S-methyltransferase [Dehalococcoidia bacterium]
MNLYETTMESPVGLLSLVASEAGLRAVLWPEERPGRVRLESPQQLGRDYSLLATAAAQLRQYFEGERREFALPLDVVGTAFQKACWRALTEIPYGSTISYGEQAARIGRPKAARAVGAANGRNPLSIVVPCHRVVAGDGALTGFGGGVEKKRWLLEHERRVCGEGQAVLWAPDGGQEA